MGLEFYPRKPDATMAACYKTVTGTVNCQGPTRTVPNYLANPASAIMLAVLRERCARLLQFCLS